MYDDPSRELGRKGLVDCTICHVIVLEWNVCFICIIVVKEYLSEIYADARAVIFIYVLLDVGHFLTNLNKKIETKYLVKLLIRKKVSLAQNYV